MKKKIVFLVSLILIVATALVTFVTYKEKNKFKVPTIENINSIKIVPAKAGLGLGTKNEVFFDLNKKEHLEMVNNILNWLKSGKIMGNVENDTLIYHGGTPTYLIIELKDGTKIQINSAIDSSLTKTQKEIVINSNDVDGQVSIYVGNLSKGTRELSPKLKSFIDNGWKDFFNYTQ